MRIIAGGQQDGISPTEVHQSRPIIAWYLVTKRPLPHVSYWFSDGSTFSSHASFQLLADVGKQDLVTNTHKLGDPALSHHQITGTTCRNNSDTIDVLICGYGRDTGYG